MLGQYPVTYKEFFITDPSTGEKKIFSQMFPSNGDVTSLENSENEIGIGEEDPIFQNWLNHYYEHDAMYDHPDYEEAYDVGPVHYQAEFKHYPGVNVQTAHAELIHNPEHLGYSNM